MSRRTIGVFLVSLLVTANLTRATVGTPPPTNQETIDPATGLVIRTTTGAPGTASFEITQGRLTVRKDVLMGRSMTTITAGSDRVSIGIDHLSIAVTTRTGGFVAPLTTGPEAMSRVVAPLAESPVVSEAAALLSRLRLDPASTTGQALTLTKALLQSVSGDRRGTLEIASWAGPMGHHTRLIAARVGSTDSDCWDAYAAAALQAANDYADCYNNTSWYNVIGRLSCSVRYDVAAENNLIGFLNCAGSSTR
jgi:hypothetical protein